jgi:hypothetical protein
MYNEFIIYDVNIYFSPNTYMIELEIKRAKSRSYAFYFYDSTGAQTQTLNRGYRSASSSNFYEFSVKLNH